MKLLHCRPLFLPLLFCLLGLWQHQCAGDEWVQNRPEFAGEELPNQIWQVGPLRTATTLQFLTLCASVAAKHADDPEATVDCFFINNKQKDATEKIRRTLGPKEYQVIKTHGRLSPEQQHILNETGQRLRDANVPLEKRPWSFHTTNKKLRDKGTAHGERRDLEGRYGFPTVMTVSTTMLGRGYQSMRKEYMKMLSLTDDQATMVYDWLRWWDELRMCCGEQMSKDWRKYLYGENSSHWSDKFGSEAGPIETCLSLDLDATERALMQTELYKRMHDQVEMLGRVSDVDEQLTGTYCSSCAENVRDFKLGFNKNCNSPKHVYCKHAEYASLPVCQNLNS